MSCSSLQVLMSSSRESMYLEYARSKVAVGGAFVRFCERAACSQKSRLNRHASAIDRPGQDLPCSIRVWPILSRSPAKS